jgi:hypothetical protein
MSNRNSLSMLTPKTKILTNRPHKCSRPAGQKIEIKPHRSQKIANFDHTHPLCAAKNPPNSQDYSGPSQPTKNPSKAMIRYITQMACQIREIKPKSQVPNP